MNKTPAYYRKRINVLEDLVQNNKKKLDKAGKKTTQGKKLEKEKRLLINGRLPEKYKEATLIKNAAETTSNEPLSLPELTRYNTFFEMHPEKIAGEEYITTSRSFPVLVKGTKEDVIRTIKSENDKSLKGIEKSGEMKHVEEIKFIKQFLALHGKIKTKAQLFQFIQRLQHAIKEQHIRKTSPYAKEIEHIQQQLLKAYHAADNLLNIQLAPATIKKFTALVKKHKGLGILPIVASAAVAAVTSKVVNKLMDGMGSVISSEELANMKFEKIGFKGKWKAFMGDPAPGFTAMIFGKPKMGKSYLAVEFAGYLARNHGKVLYVAREEGLDATFQLKLKDKNVAHPDLFISSYLPEDLSPYNFVVLDSVNKLQLSPEELEKLKKNYPAVSFIYIFQTTKEGNFRGSNHFQHDVDVVIEIPEKGKAIQNGRFNQGGEMNIFDEEKGGSGPKKFENWKKA